FLQPFGSEKPIHYRADSRADRPRCAGEPDISPREVSMRPRPWTPIIAALLLITGPLAGQRREEARQILPLANYTEAVVLDPNNPQQERSFAVDDAERVYISILSNSTTLEVTLIDSGGGLHPLGALDAIVRASYRGPSVSPTAKPSYEF